MNPPSVRAPWHQRLAIISGGSSGLGRHLALCLAEQGAHVTILGRDRQRLASIESEALRAGAASARTFAVDVCQPLTRDASHESATDDRAAWNAFIATSPCDLLIQAVGQSDRGRLDTLTANDLIHQFEVNVVSSLHMTQSCWGALQRSHGVVVNIASLAGILAGPQLGGYCTAKHALVGLHRQWRAEAAGSGIHFLLVCPGPIQREGPSNRYDALVAKRGLDANAAKPGGGVQVRRLDPEVLSERILRAAARRELELIVPGKASWLAALMALWPSWADRIVRAKMGG
ncbi:MAG: SDR family NAD(P)-dependent oxidoreductase [Pirellula sp.]